MVYITKFESMKQKKKVQIYTDGGCHGNPGPGAWAFLIRYNAHEKMDSGFEKHTTNNRMELEAAIQGLKYLKEPVYVDLFTDSQYLMKGVTEWIHQWIKNAWKTSNKSPVKNKDLWQDLVKNMESHEISWHWVKGHSGHPENERVDQLVQETIKQSNS